MELTDILRIKKQVTLVADAVASLRTAGVREEALITLIVAAAPRGPRGGVAIKAAEVQMVLRGIANLPDFVFDRSEGDQHDG